MTVSGVGIKTSILASRILDLQSQFDSLQTQLATGKKSNTYAGMGTNRGFAVALRAQISSIDSFADTQTNVTTRINVANAALDPDCSDRNHGAGRGGDVLDADHQQWPDHRPGHGAQFARRDAEPAEQPVGRSLPVFRTRHRHGGDGGDRDILDGVGAQAGLKQLIAERKQADVGSGTGRLTQATPTPTSISLTEDTGPFGLKLASITSSAASVTTTGPTGSPATGSFDLGATNLNTGDTITLAFNLPDGTSENVQLTATTTTPPQAGQFLIGANSTATAANVNAALTTAVGALANGALVAASAMKASSEFFGGSPVPRVGGPPFATATTQVPGTAANTLSWYTGETGTDPARGTAVARVDDGITVQYGARANEPALTSQLQTIAAMAAMSTTAGDPNASAQIGALYQRVATKLLAQPGQQSVQDIQADFAGAQTAMQSASDRQTQTKNTAETMLQSIEGVTDAEVTAKLLAVQNSLNASYQTTAMRYQTSLLKFL
jgi:flagellin-like hook-associated protein FlgL